MELKDFLSNYEEYLNKEAVKEDVKMRKEYFDNIKYDYEPLDIAFDEDDDDELSMMPTYPLKGAILHTFDDYNNKHIEVIYHGRNPITGGHIISDEKDYERKEITSSDLGDYYIAQQGSGDKEWYDRRNYLATLREMEAMGFSKGGRLKKFLGDAYETGRKVTHKAKEKAREGVHNASKRNTLDVLRKMKKERKVTDDEIKNIEVTEDVVQDHYLFEPKPFVPRKSDGKNISGVVEITPKKEMGGEIGKYRWYEIDYYDDDDMPSGQSLTFKNDEDARRHAENFMIRNDLRDFKVTRTDEVADEDYTNSYPIMSWKKMSDGGGVKKKRKQVPNITYTATIQVVDAKGKEQPTAIPTLEMTLSSDKSVAEVKDIFKESIEQSAGFKKGNQVEITEFYLGSMDTPEEERVYFDFKEEEEEAENFEPRVKRSGKWDESYSTLCDELATYQMGGEISAIELQRGDEWDVSNQDHKLPNRAIRYNVDKGRYELYNYTNNEVDYSYRELSDLIRNVNNIFNENFVPTL